MVIALMFIRFSKPVLLPAILFTLCCHGLATQSTAHDITKHAAARRRAALLTQARNTVALQASEAHCHLTVKLVDAETQQPIPGIVRITRKGSDEPLAIKEWIVRGSGWHSATATSEVSVPQTTVTIESVRGIETKLARATIDLSNREKHEVTLPVRRFFDARSRGWRSGNTHLHLMNLTFAEADRYLREVPLSDDLDLVYLSHLRRIPDEKTYISNLIVENSLPGGDLARLSQTGVLFRPGEEHRHNFGRGGQGYGHVMLLDIAKLIRPVSIGPGIMREGTDGIPLQRGIREARGDGASVIWCHNTFGFEDLPNWLAGLVDAQNIFDGGNRGSYEESYYRYLNLGLKVPFSTGTDWFIDDFSRVYVPLEGKLKSDAWLKQLKAGRTLITNGPLLELTADRRPIGDTIELEEPRAVRIEGRATSRVDFGRLELVHNGEVVTTIESKQEDGVFAARLTHKLRCSGPGWLAVRTPLDDTKNELNNQLYSHTSPIYIEFQGRHIFHRTAAQQMLEETREDLKSVSEHAKFGSQQERQAVLQVYEQGIADLQRRLDEAETRTRK